VFVSRTSPCISRSSCKVSTEGIGIRLSLCVRPSLLRKLWIGFGHGTCLDAKMALSRATLTLNRLQTSDQCATRTHHSRLVSTTGNASMPAPSKTALVGVGRTSLVHSAATFTSKPASAKAASAGLR